MRFADRDAVTGSGSGSLDNSTGIMPEDMPSNNNMMDTDNDTRSSSFEASIELPAEVFENANESDFRVLYSAYQMPTLFPVASDSSALEIEVATFVIGASIPGMEVSNLSDPVVIRLQTTIQVKHSPHTIYLQFGMVCFLYIVCRIIQKNCQQCAYHGTSLLQVLSLYTVL